MIDALRTCDNTVQICHYKVSYKDTRRNTGEELTRKFITEEEANTFVKEMNGVVSSIDTSDCDWMDGMELSVASNPMNEAVKLYHLGQAGYEAQCRREASQKPEKVRADIDYMMLMGGF